MTEPKRMTLKSILNGREGCFIPKSIFPAYVDESEMIQFIEAWDDQVTAAKYNTGNGTCSILLYTKGGYTLAYNGYLSKV